MDIEDVDNFLARAKGSRTINLGKSQGLFHYIGKLNKDTIAIYHSKYTEKPQLPLLAFKALSRVVGSKPINKGVDKIILVEKQEAIRIFGYMPGLNVCRASYFATLGAYMLAHVGCARDLLRLKDYKKQKYLRFRGDLDLEEGSSDRKDVKVEEAPPNSEGKDTV